MDDEQALLAIVRYNRLIDTFLGLTTYSLQNHLRTTVKGIGQIEIDELYIGMDKRGCHFVIPVQAKGGKNQIGIVQPTQDIRFVGQKFPGLRCRAIAAQFMDDQVIALFELALVDKEVKVVEERHYRLVPARANWIGRRSAPIGIPDRRFTPHGVDPQGSEAIQGRPTEP